MPRAIKKTAVLATMLVILLIAPSTHARQFGPLSPWTFGRFIFCDVYGNCGLLIVPAWVPTTPTPSEEYRPPIDPRGEEANRDSRQECYFGCVDKAEYCEGACRELFPSATPAECRECCAQLGTYCVCECDRRHGATTYDCSELERAYSECVDRLSERQRRTP